MSDQGLAYLGVGIGVGLCVVGGAFGIARIGAAALLADARQPEEASKLRALMIITAALIEGLAFFALVIFFMVALALNENLNKPG